jgi:hypothetical protein
MNDIFFLLSPSSIENNLELIEDTIKKADDASLTAEQILEDLAVDVRSHDVWFYLNADRKVTYILLAESVGDVYFISRIARTNYQPSLSNPYQLMLDEVKGRALYLQKESVAFCGTIMWETKLKDLGFTIDQYYYKYQLDTKGGV